MKIVQINTFPYKATGTIMMNIHRRLQKEGYESYVVWGRGRTSENQYEIAILDDLGVKIHGVYTRITDKTGFASWKYTRKLIAKFEQIQPDIIHLHNIHGYFINVEMLFQYIKKNHIKVIWTLHDCWAFTGHCAYFDAVGCEKWKTGCYQCEQKYTYPSSSLFDASEWNWNKKKELFTGCDITVVAPSMWLKGLVEQSFLKEYTVKVINNGIDTEVFLPRKSDFRVKYQLEKSFIILGVASEWTERKGLRDFIRLAEMLSHDRKYKIVLIGLSKKQMNEIPDSILGMERTSNVQELVELYSAADVYFNPTYEDNYPTTNLEAICCGTPVVTYRTGGSPESIDEETGIILEQGAVEEFACWIRYEASKKQVSCEQNGELIKKFSQSNMTENYLKLYAEEVK
ncbi:MAG: glycosyltransferase [Turicibacter sp.]